MRRGDIGLAVLWIVLGAAVCAHALRLGVWDIPGPATGFVPLLTGIVLFAGGAGILLAARPWGAPAPPFWPVRAAGLRALTVLVALAVMAVSMPALGFLVTAMGCTMLLLRLVAPQRWGWVVLTAVASTVLLYWLFDRVLDMALPKGPLGF